MKLASTHRRVWYNTALDYYNATLMNTRQIQHGRFTRVPFL